MLKHCFSVLAVLIMFLPGNAVPTSTVPALTKMGSCNLTAPSTFTAVWRNSTTASLNWSSVSGATAYHLEVYDTNGLVSSTTEYGTSKNVGGLNNAESYTCRLSSICGDNTTSEFIITADVVNL